jgi:hypothetical protein
MVNLDINNISSYFNIYCDKSIQNKLSLCIFPKSQNGVPINIGEYLKSNFSENKKIHVYIVCDISNSMNNDISANPLTKINYNNREIIIPDNISKNRKSIGFTTTALIGHILHTESKIANISTNIHVLPFSTCVKNYKFYENVEKNDDIDKNIFQDLLSESNNNKNGGTFLSFPLRKINNLIQNTDEEDIKIVLILTDGALNDNEESLKEYHNLLNYRNISIGCVSMGYNTDIKTIKSLNSHGYFYVGDFLCENPNSNNLLDIMPYILYNLFSNISCEKENNNNNNIKSLSIISKNFYNKNDYCKKKRTSQYESCEIFEYNNYKLEIWNVDSDYDSDTEFKKIKSFNYIDCDDYKWDISHFLNDIYYPIDKNKICFVNNTMTPIYIVINYDINTKLYFSVTLEKEKGKNILVNINIDIDKLQNNINATNFFEMLEKTNSLIKHYSYKDIFKNITGLKDRLKTNRNDINNYELLLEEIKNLNKNFLLHLEKLNNFLSIINNHDISESNSIEKFIVSFSKETIRNSINFIKNKKSELFNPHNTNTKLHTTTSMRHASNYKSLISLKKSNTELVNLDDSIMCKICMSNVSNMCNIYCGHISTCSDNECIKYMDDIEKCILCRNNRNKITGLIKVLLDDNLYDCVLCKMENKENKCNYLFDCGHVGFCDDCVNKSQSKFFDCHQCKKKVRILCKIFI